MTEDEERQRKERIRSKIARRYSAIVALMALLAICIIVKAGFIMFAERQYWREVADRFVKENMPVPPNRGNIISSDGQLMATSLPEYKIYMDFKAGGIRKDTLLMKHLDEICDGLHKIFPDRSAKEFRTQILKGRKEGSRNFLLYPKRVSYIKCKEVEKLPVFCMSPNSGGYHKEQFNKRNKPFGSLATRTLGDMYPDLALGPKNGLEMTYDSILRGQSGIKHRQKVMNKYLDFLDKPPVDGMDIITTIDVDIQDIAEKALTDQLKNLTETMGSAPLMGVAVVMEVATGEVKANVNMELARDGRYYERRNIAVSNLMEPGSTFKTASIMVALEDGYITPDYMVDTGCGIVDMHGSKMRDWNWHRGGYGKIDVTRIMEVSSNVGVSMIIDKYYKNDPQKFVDGIHRMSLDTPLNLGFVGEATPRIKGPKERSNFSRTSLPWMSIGYETQIPPIYLLNFYNAIANNGVMVKPKFVKAIARDGEIVERFPTEVVNPKICSDKTLGMIRDILRKVVSQGLAKPAGSNQFSVSGKTGTAQVSQGRSGYKSGGVSYLVSFCGYFPSEAPQYSCIVQIHIPHGPASGGLQAGSVFSKIAERIYAHHLFADVASARDSTSVMVPDVKRGDMSEAALVLRKLHVNSRGDAVSTASDNPVWGSVTNTGVAAEMQLSTPPEKVVPSVIGMGAKDAVYLLESRGLRVHLTGKGQVRSQSIHSGSPLHKGQTILLTLN